MTARESGFKFPASARLKSSWEFDLVFKTGRAAKGELTQIRYLRGREGTRIGVAVGKKIAGAVQRSRGRRMLRESFRRLAPWIIDGVWAVASLKERGLRVNAVSVYEEAALLLAKSGLLVPEWGGADWRADERRISQGI